MNQRICIATDAWHPQINGVVTTLSQTADTLTRWGHEVRTITPEQFSSIPCPTYPEIRLSGATPARIRKYFTEFAPHAVHIATEGPIGWAARRACMGLGFSFTTSYHTRFPEYVRMRFPVPLGLSYLVVRRFHNAAVRTMVATQALQDELAQRDFHSLVPWSRGVDTNLFRPADKNMLKCRRPIFMYVGRIAVEKNLEAFFELDLPGTKYAVGDGPALAKMKHKYPDVQFPGYRTGRKLADLMAAADVFVFPSLTDTFGVVLLESMACGVPVAAFPVVGPKTTVRNGINGWLAEDLRQAALQALKVPADSCRKFAQHYSWERCTGQFYSNLALQEALSGSRTVNRQQARRDKV